MFGKKYDIGGTKASAVIETSIDKINLGDWMFSLTSEEYQACSVGHQAAAQAVMPDGKRLSINVETIDGVQFVQNYIEEISERSHVLGISRNSQVWSHNRSGVIEVHWDLTAKAIDKDRSEITCLVKSYTKRWIMAKIIRAQTKKHPVGQTPLDLHVIEEAPLFAKDIEAKANSGVWA